MNRAQMSPVIEAGLRSALHDVDVTFPTSAFRAKRILLDQFSQSEHVFAQAKDRFTALTLAVGKFVLI